jgi:BMFP domain-containing protein YqiC
MSIHDPAIRELRSACYVLDKQAAELDRAGGSDPREKADNARLAARARDRVASLRASIAALDSDQTEESLHAEHNTKTL